MVVKERKYVAVIYHIGRKAELNIGSAFWSNYSDFYSWWFHVSSTLILIAIFYDSLSLKFLVCDTVCVADFCKFASLDQLKKSNAITQKKHPHFIFSKTCRVHAGLSHELNFRQQQDITKPRIPNGKHYFTADVVLGGPSWSFCDFWKVTCCNFIAIFSFLAKAIF